MDCPKCGARELWRDSVDVGVGFIHGPYGCSDCGWSESGAYDLSEGQDAFDEKGGMIDPFGGYYPPDNPIAIMCRRSNPPKP